MPTVAPAPVAPETPPVALEVSGVGKKYCRDPRRSLLYAMNDLLRTAVGMKRAEALREGEFWALEQISFTLARGECLAIIGANGAGKSTLLKVVHGRMPPDAGSVRLAGQLAAVSDLGLGFEPRLSGRANARHAAELLGLERGAGDALLEAILAFSGLGALVDAPVSTYSSGMRARLGFAVAAQLRPDVLLVDEALAVGDLAFRRKCIRHLAQSTSAGRSLVLVSHDLYTLQVLCSRALVLDHGRLIFDGPTSDAIAVYLESMRDPATDAAAAVTAGSIPNSEHPVLIDSVALVGQGGGEPTTGAPAEVVLRYRAATRIAPIPWFFQVVSADLTLEIAAGIGAIEEDGQVLEVGAGELRVSIPKLPLLAGTYGLRAALVDPWQRTVLALSGWNETPAFFRVAAPRDELARLLRLSHSLVEIETARSAPPASPR
ncbi:MAG: ABC transporter ATP-binding protein [Thermoanaerobaculia bacterium]